MEEKIQVLLKEKFRMPSFREGQADIIDSVLRSQDAMAVMPTGGGKSLCYQLPSLYREGIVIVVSPLISLMKDQVKGLRKLGLPAGCLFSGQDFSEKQQVFAQLKTEKNYLLYLSPERVQKPGFASWLRNQSISLFAIDESHCVSQWGHDFRPDYHRLTLLRDILPQVPILALTATATPMVLSDIQKHLKLRKPDRHIHGFYRPNLYYQVEFCENMAQKRAYLRQALRQTPRGRILIYCGTRKQCEELADDFKTDFNDIDFYHAGMDAKSRHQVQKDFEDGKIRILAATNAFGMGIDHPDVRLVVHYQMPANIESLYQEMGRAGRDGEDSTCILLYARRDRGLQAYFINQSDAAESNRKHRWRSLDAITQFAEGAECRHAGVLTYFRDAKRIQTCGHCDTCDPNSSRKISQPEWSGEELITAKKPKSKAFQDQEPLTETAQVRSDCLKEWRKNYAKEKDIPAFMIFSNKTLRDLARRDPQTLSELEKVYGMGPHKIEHLGDLILEQLAICRD